MMNNYLDNVAIKTQTKSGIQIACARIIIPDANISTADSGMIITKSFAELMGVIAGENNRKIIFWYFRKIGESRKNSEKGNAK